MICLYYSPFCAVCSCAPADSCLLYSLLSFARARSKAFAMMSLKEEDAHPDVTGVDADHMKILQDWYDKLSEKYPTVGSVAGNTFGYTLEQAVVDAKKEITKKYD